MDTTQSWVVMLQWRVFETGMFESETFYKFEGEKERDRVIQMLDFSQETSRTRLGSKLLDILCYVKLVLL